jgi:hypothetical protein
MRAAAAQEQPDAQNDTKKESRTYRYGSLRLFLLGC